MKKSLQFSCLALALMCAETLSAQSLRQVIFSTGGSFMNPGNQVKVYSYDPVAGTAGVFDARYGDFSNDLVVDSGFAYVHIGRASGSPAGTDMIIKYDLNTHLAVDSITSISGVQKFIVTPEHLVATFGYGASSYFVRFYNKQTLDLVFYDNTLTDMTTTVTFLNDSIYAGFTRNDSGAVAVYSTNPIARQHIQLFDTLSSGIMTITHDGNAVYLFGERYDQSTFAFDYGSITRYMPATKSHVTALTSLSQAIITIRQDTIFGEFGNTNSYMASTLTPLNFTIGTSYSDGAYDIYGGKYYLQETDFFSFGNLVAVERNGSTITDTEATDFAGSAIALDYFGSPLNVAASGKSDIAVFPNPSSDHIYLTGTEHSSFKIMNLTGQVVLQGRVNQGNPIMINMLSPGVYILKSDDTTIRFVKK